MIVGIGIDVVEIRRIRQLARRHATFLSRTFAPVELHHCQAKANPFPHLAARFAAKEAVFKALGTGWTSPSRTTQRASPPFGSAVQPSALLNTWGHTRSTSR